MPIFEFRCLQCGNVFEKLFNNKQEEFVAQCPACNAEHLERVISRTNYIIGQAKPTDKSCGTGNICTSFEIPGPE